MEISPQKCVFPKVKPLPSWMVTGSFILTLLSGVLGVACLVVAFAFVVQSAPSTEAFKSQSCLVEKGTSCGEKSAETRAVQGEKSADSVTTVEKKVTVTPIGSPLFGGGQVTTTVTTRTDAEGNVSQQREVVTTNRGSVGSSCGTSLSCEDESLKGNGFYFRSSGVAGENVSVLPIAFLVGGGVLFLLFLVPQCVVHFMLMYRTWSVMQAGKSLFEGNERVMSRWLTPGVATFLNLVPLFNYYWAFPSYCRLSEFGALLCAKLGMKYRGPSENLSLAYGITMVAAFVVNFTVLAYPFFFFFLDRSYNALIADLSGKEVVMVEKETTTRVLEPVLP